MTISDQDIFFFCEYLEDWLLVYSPVLIINLTILNKMLCVFFFKRDGAMWSSCLVAC